MIYFPGLSKGGVKNFTAPFLFRKAGEEWYGCVFSNINVSIFS
nr:MAG TPA: hypothetical protein [Caudoviricetes sp.]